MRDRVLTYFGYDGEIELPEEGVAVYNGEPHYFWLRTALPEPRTAIFDIAPIDQRLLDAVTEYEAIWRKWDLSYHAGEVELSTHPLLEGNNPRYAALVEQIGTRAEALRKIAHQKRGLIDVSEKHILDTQRYAGKQWPYPGMRSAELEVTWEAS